MSNKPILYSFRRCPYAMRARMALLASEQQVILREVLLRDKPSQMIEASQKGTVPVAVLQNGRVIDESLEVMRWALEQNDPLDWLACSDDALIAANDGPFKQALDHYKYPTRYDLEDITKPRGKGLLYLQKIDKILDGRRYLAGEKPGFTDIAIFPFIRQFSMVDTNWFTAQTLPNLQPWLASLLDSECFKTAMVKHAPWKEGDPATMFP